ncbi:hypothetical protein TUM4438_32580 [Shewanella sairae]|uniref:SnoaL-like domain-containing protein n=1 Tax=Shewanella sairae TaxID=190310 RepID=A0ABQ4PM58_9GAMM|nr:SgcJ/EcaC family oxidoreductase [Shewanella sairae]MCL1131468.1 SgcJ/EcaC family oxidoreductase [Shewanella sairae]GIU49292.1 hypothetical protein TUM4438_32580 [Shewanella sairae]
MNTEIEQLINRYAQVLNNADTSILSEVFTTDAVFIGQPFPTATGIEAIEATYKAFLSQLNFKVQFEVTEVELGESIGYLQTRSYGSIVPKGQQADGEEGNREMFIVKKIDGNWKLHRYIFNAEINA